MKLQIHARRRYLAVAIAAVTAAANQAWAADSCARFKWDVGLEHSLFLGPALEAQGAASVNDSPWLNVGTLYDLKLRPQEGVNFVHAPGKKMIADGAYAGVARFRVEQGGHYRISLGVPFWIDVVDGSELIPTADFGGSPGCDTPHKIVEYVLPPGRELVLQVSAGVVGDVKLSITRVAAAP